ncbi:MAG: D-alanyl-D-alanine-carboxypeptidase/endopeptidase AmpH [Acidobacteriota bacterium]|nr:D-alanyl-D-alanine-carboxypeptidase/endopeptidase AmpH [Acidobacteriota bacterium]
MRLVLAFLLFLSLLPAVAQTESPLALENLNDANQMGEELYRGSGATGLVLVVVRGNQVFFHGYGETAPGSGQTPTKESIIRLCSLTKIFTTDLLSKMVADGTVHLDDPLQKYAPQGDVVPEKGAQITLLDLATHTAGLSREIGTAPRHTPHFTYPDYATRWQWLQTTHLLYTPGTQAYYSNIGFDLLSDALADAAHKPYATLLWERTIKPLHMWQTTFYPTAGQCERLMQSARREGPCTITENTEGSSGLYSTPADMATWLEYLIGAGGSHIPVQADASHAIYLLPSSLQSQYGLSHAGRVSGIGLGWLHLRANGDPQHIIQKTGGGAGFTTYIALHPASHTALFVAATEGSPRAGEPGFHLYKAANNVLLALAGLPPLPQPVFHARTHRRLLRASRREHSRRAVGRRRSVGRSGKRKERAE